MDERNGDMNDGIAAQSGGVIPGTRKAAFSVKLPDDLPIPVLIAVPHAGRAYPENIITRMRRPEYSAIRLEDRHVDQLASLVARRTGAGLLVAKAPRAMLDLNRATDDVDWEMIRGAQPDGARHSLANRRARNGLGLIPRRLPGLGEIWTGPTEQMDLDARIQGIHTPYHAALSSALQSLRDQWGAALLIDFHSMPPLKKVHSEDQPAHFVVGDRFGASSDDRLVARALQQLADSGARVAHNRPYAGGYVLDRHANPARSIHAIQLEICRSLYLESDMSSLSADIAELSETLSRLVRSLGEETVMLGGRRPKALPIAAE